MLRIVSVVAAILAIAMVVIGCESMGKMGSGSMASLKDLAGEWTLSKLEGTDLASLLPASMKKPTLGIGADGKVTGFTGVNRLSSMIDTEALLRGEFKLGPAVTTKMAGPPEAMAVESKFLEALSRAKGAKVSGGELSMTDGAKELLRFVKGA